MRPTSRCSGSVARALLVLPVLLLLLSCLSSCGPAEAEPRTRPQESAPGGAAVPQAGDPAEAVAPVDPPALAAVRAEPVVGRTGPGGHTFEVAIREPGRAGHERLIGRRTFQVALREVHASDQACSSCHRPGRPVSGPDRVEDAHRYLLPRHPDGGGSPCTTCHAPDDVEQLVLAGGGRVPIEHAYRLCAQCHYRQADDWAAGAHGKRLDGWLGRRVVMGCADCHDPHAPAMVSRVPFPGPRLPRAGTGTP